MAWLCRVNATLVISVMIGGLGGCTDSASRAASNPDAGDSPSAGGGGGRNDEVLKHDAAAHDPTLAGPPVAYMVPPEGGAVMVNADTGAPVNFAFPPSAAGKMITLTPTAASEIGWPADQFVQVIKMEPDGAQFAEPIVIRPATGDVIVLDFPSSAQKSRPDGLPLNSAGDGFLLSHFSTLVVVAPGASCDSASGWQVAPADEAAQHCMDPAYPTYISFGCQAYAYCLVIDAHCCAPAGASACHLTDKQLAVSYTASPDSSGAFAYCASRDAGSAGDASVGGQSDAATATLDAGSPDSAQHVCEPNASSACDCQGNPHVGTRVCNQSGSAYASCECAPLADDASAGSDAGASDAGSAADAGSADGGASSDAGASDAGVDAGTDGGAADGGASPDAGASDGGVDSGTDGGTDAGASDGGVDSGTDAGASDGGVDAGADSGAPDSGVDAGTDGGAADSGVDAGMDGGAADGGVDGGAATCQTSGVWSTATTVSDVDRLLAVWASPTSDSQVWAVGGSVSTQKPLVAHFDGQSWTSQTLGETPGLLTAIWGADASNVIAVGKGGAIWKLLGSTWTAVSSPTSEDLFGVWGVDPFHYWVVGTNGAAWAFTGEAWVDHSLVSDPNNNVIGTLHGVWGTSLNDIRVVNSTGAASATTYVVQHFNGSWSADTDTNNSYTTEGLWGASNDDIWAVGYIKEPSAHWDGTRWLKGDALPGMPYLHSVWGQSSTSVWAVGDNGQIDYWNGAAWTTCTRSSGALYGVAGSQSKVWAVGNVGVILRHDVLVP